MELPCRTRDRPKSPTWERWQAGERVRKCACVWRVCTCMCVCARVRVAGEPCVGGSGELASM